MDMGILAYVIGFFCMFHPVTLIIFGVSVAVITGAPIWVYVVGIICTLSEIK